MGHAGHVGALTVAAVFACLIPAAHAQTTQPATEPRPLGNSLAAEALTDLPSGATIYSLLDTTVPEVISDRVDAGSLTAGTAARLGTRGNSWTQTMFRIGDVDITDPDGSGTPFMLPGVLTWQRMEVATGAMAVGANAPGLAVTLVPLRPGATWTRSFSLIGARPGLISRTEPTNPPAIARLNTWTSGTLLVSGPLVPGRLGIVAAGEWTNTTHFRRDDSTQLRESLGSFFTNLVFTPNAQDEVGFIGWVQRTQSPFTNRLAWRQPEAAERSTSVHLQSEWEGRKYRDWPWTGFASFTARQRTTDLQRVPAIVTERLEDGPVPDLLAPFGTDKAWSIGAKVAPAKWRERHTPQGGLTLSGGSVRARAPFAVRVGELVDGLPSRAWDYSEQGADSEWHETTLSLYAADSYAVHPRVTIDGGIRFDLVTGGATGAVNGFSWSNWFPNAGIRFELTDYKRIAALMRFSRYGHRMPLGDLAYGDPSAPTANVYRWTPTGPDPQVQQIGPLISRVGPGTGGDRQFVTIDPNLGRPYMDEVALGFESRPSEQATVRMIGVVRREHQLMGLVDTGVPTSSYSTFTVVDPGSDQYGGYPLTVYNRLPSAFGADRYLLTNPAGHQTTFVGVEVTAQMAFEKLFLMAGGTAGRSEGQSANRGFLATENDAGIIGELFTDPNAATNARGRLFTERGYTIKTAGTYHFPHDFRVGVVGRYQDGQHFARLVIVPDLNQGVEAIRAFVNGKTRFTYTMTFDARLQKGFTIGSRRLAFLVDAYNVFNTKTEIEEFPVTGPISRLTSAVRPPRSVHLGLKLDF